MPLEANTKAHRRANRNAYLALIATIVAWLSIILSALLLVPRVVPAGYRFNDFYDYYIGSRLFWDGKYPYGVMTDLVALARQYGLRFSWATGYSYPPFLAMVFGPLLLLRPETVAWLWVGASMLGFCLLVCLVARKVEGPWRRVAVGFYLLSIPRLLFALVFSAGTVSLVLDFAILLALHKTGGSDSNRAWSVSLPELL